jgi:restriction system protein
MTKNENLKSGYAKSDLCQRLRLVESESEDLLKGKIKQIEDEWNYESFRAGILGYDKHRAFDFIKYNPNYKYDNIVLKNEALKKTVDYPSFPNAQSQITYQSCLLPLYLENTQENTIHLDDYQNFLNSVKYAPEYRLDYRLSNPFPYPVDKPRFANFPVSIKEPSFFKIKDKPQEPDALIPQYKWYHQLFFWKYFEITRLNKQANRSLKVKHDLALLGWEQIKSESEEFNLWLMELINDRRMYWEHKKKDYENICNKITAKWAEDKSNWEEAVTKDIMKARDFHLHYQEGSAIGVCNYFNAHLKSIQLPLWVKREYQIEFDEDAGILLLNLRLPYLSDIQILKTRHLKTNDKLVPATQKEERQVKDQLLYFMLLRFMWEILQVDNNNLVSMVCCNGFVVYNDPATGRQRQDVIMSVVSKKEDLQDILLDRVDPKACFLGLKGVVASKPSELVPIQPLIQFNKNDKRFVAGKEVLSSMVDQNLATMDWQDFEHLIREIFEKEFAAPGAEVRVTQASRDRGVDAIIFDPDPLRGGKFVIQAKRYTNTVDVSAVRDLYGTVLNEGANRGILVTTSNYGRDAHDFSKDKPITLINGAELLHLLQKHGYNAKIDIKEAKRLLME